ncbi:TraX family protein [Pseudoxanthomonas sp. LjRoot168]
MTFDHTNKVLWAGSFQWMSDASRIVFPIFAIVLAYNLASNHSTDRVRRSLFAMLVCAVIAQPLHAAAFGIFLPLNVLFTLALGVYVAYERNWFIAFAAFAIGGVVVDYQWMGVAVVVTATWAIRYPSRLNYSLLVASVASLQIINGTWWALAAFPVLWLLGQVDAYIPRHRWVFLGYYVLHLGLLAALAYSI